LQAKRLPVTGNGLDRPPLASEDKAAVIVSRGVIGSEFQGFPEGLQCEVPVFLGQEGDAQVVVCLGVVRPERERLA
jgi:hypothetical protein